MLNRKNTKEDNYNFTSVQLKFFACELKEAGGFDELMIKKQSIERNEGCTTILKYNDIEKYKKIYLTGIYSPFRQEFNTNVPYAFWTQLYIALKTKYLKMK